jgi:hypothetical protein
MDLAGPASIRRALILSAALFLVAFSIAQNSGSRSPDPQADTASQLAAQEKWQQIVDLAERDSSRSAELNYYYGLALAHLQQWPQAHHILREAQRKQPDDERFPLELAGVDFKQKKYADSAHHLRRALQLKPNDSYANEFLATDYFLLGNLEAALKYWNRSGKPQIRGVRSNPKPRIDPALLDRAFTFSPASTLTRSQLQSTQARIQGLDVFPVSLFELQARDDGQFDVVFTNQERNRFGSSPWEALLHVFRGLPAQTVYPEFFNFHHRAINFISMYRWDAEKRRVRAELSGPLRLNPKRRAALGLDLRSENWDIRPSFAGTVPVLGSFNLRREALNAQVTTFQTGRWNWTAGAEFSHRDFRDIALGSALTPDLLPKGYQLKQTLQTAVDLIRIPEQRLSMTGTLSSSTGRIWSNPAHGFEKLQAELRLHWFPQSQGDDYELQHTLRGGKTWGALPFDELYTLGILGDADLTLRGHITTHDGRKGSAPLARNYFLSNWGMDKKIFDDGLLAVKLGPFLDTGRITDPLPGFSSRKWLWDTGAQLKINALGVGVVLTYGRDLRSGNHAISVSLMNK